jgi:Ala-tRNA(Pro) deacylase
MYDLKSPHNGVVKTPTPEPLSSFFKTHDIAVATYQHEPVFTVNEGRHIKDALPGGHTKNLFLKDKKDRIFLITAIEDSVIDLKTLHKYLGCDRLSFGKAELMLDLLKVTPGSVTPFALFHAMGKNLTFILDAKSFAFDLVHYHPCQNDMTTVIKPADLWRFSKICGFTPLMFDFLQMTAISYADVLKD